MNVGVTCRHLFLVENSENLLTPNKLVEIDNTGPFFTWTNGRRDSGRVDSRLDQTLISGDFTTHWIDKIAFLCHDIFSIPIQ